MSLQCILAESWLCLTRSPNRGGVTLGGSTQLVSLMGAFSVRNRPSVVSPVSANMPRRGLTGLEVLAMLNGFYAALKMSTMARTTT